MGAYLAVTGCSCSGWEGESSPAEPVVSEIYQDQDWDGSGGLANYVDVLLERLVAIEDALPTNLLKRQLSETNWDRLRMSGTFIRGKQVDELEELWSNHLASIAQNDTGPSLGQAMLMRHTERRSRTPHRTC